MILHCCDNRKMQDQNLVEIHSGVEVSNQLKPLSAKLCATSLSENSNGADVHRLNHDRHFDGSLELEMVPDRDTDGRICEGSLESLPDTSMVESSSTWGDFEGFSEVKLENLSNSLESFEKLNEKQTQINDVDVSDNCPSTSCRQTFSKTTGYNRGEIFANVSRKAALSSEEIIKLSFPAVAGPQFLEKISCLDDVIYTKAEDADIPECTKKQLSTESGNLWKTLTHSNNPSSIKCPWIESHYQENLLAVLGIDAHQKALPEGKNDILEKTNIRENEDTSVDKFNFSTCKALIQTKLSVSPAPKQSHLFPYNLFLKKTPSGGNMQYITVPQKKRIFTTQSLRMKMFSSNVC